MVDTPLKRKQHNIRFDPEQYRILEQRAAQCGMRIGTWMRSILMQAATQKPRKGYLHIREPDGATT